jgi:chromosomal replication initiation ATPase DnaA
LPARRHFGGTNPLMGDPEFLQDRRTKNKDLRQMAMELSYRYNNYKQKEIGAIFGVDYSTVSQNRMLLKNKLKSSLKLKKQFDQLANTKI